MTADDVSTWLVVVPGLDELRRIITEFHTTHPGRITRISISRELDGAIKAAAKMPDAEAVTAAFGYPVDVRWDFRPGQIRIHYETWHDYDTTASTIALNTPGQEP